MAQKNVYFLINSLKGGGAEAVLVRLLPYLNPKAVILLEKNIKYKISQELLKDISYSFKTPFLLKPLFYSLNLVKIIETSSIVISFLHNSNYVNIFSKLFKKHKAIITVHNTDLLNPFIYKKKKRQRLLAKLLYPKADLIIAVSKGVKKSLTELNIPEEKIKIIYNPCPVNEICKKIEEPLNEYEEIFKNPVIINVGSLNRQKGQWWLLKIFKELKKNFSDLKLIILGEGILKDYLVKFSEELGLKTFVWNKDRLSSNYDVYFLGFQENPFKFIAKSKLFILSSLWEGFSNVIIEAMACGVPVVSSDCKSGPREILAPDSDFDYQTNEPEFARYGILMPVFNLKFKKVDEPLEKKENLWIETIKHLLEKNEIRQYYSRMAKQRAEDFRIEKIIQIWKEIIS